MYKLIKNVDYIYKGVAEKALSQLW